MEPVSRDNSTVVIRVVLAGVLLLCVFAVIYAAHTANLRSAAELAKNQAPTKYTNYVYEINLSYPSSWLPTPGYNYDHYDGVDGFFSIEAVGSATADIDVLARSEAAGLPVEKTTVNNQAARIIDGRELLVKYPKPVVVGTETLGYFLLKTDRAHFKEIMSTLTFVIR